MYVKNTRYETFSGKTDPPLPLTSQALNLIKQQLRDSLWTPPECPQVALKAFERLSPDLVMERNSRHI